MSAWPITLRPLALWLSHFALRPIVDHARVTVMTFYLPSIPASLQTLGRCECVATCAPASLGLRIISPLAFYLSFLGAIWTYDKNLAPIFLYLPPTPPLLTRAPRPLHPWLSPKFPGTSSATPPPYRLLRHSGLLASPHALPACNKRSCTPLRLLLFFTNRLPVAWALPLQLPTAPRPLLCTSTVTNQLTTA
jgi:hypothetical protein